MDGTRILTGSGEELIASDHEAMVVNKSLFFRAEKRLFDITASIVGLIILLPVFAVIAAVIKVKDRGPVFYQQKRNGLNGRVFSIYKFRTMCIDAERMHEELLVYNELDGPAFKMKDDPRITKTGKFLRRTSLDELPQLVNILKGEMSFVGPRPLPVYETEQCNDYQKQRMLIKPGLTCYWQCSGRNDLSFDEWIEMDLRYIKEASMWVDLKIIWKTFGAVLFGGGAY